MARLITGDTPADAGRYLLVGVTCAGANNLLLIGGAAAGLHYTVCIALTVLIVLPASYPAHACWTFRGAMSWGSFGRYLLGSLSGVVIASLMVALLCGPL
ncbi:GtrA family protein, partial [Sphingomonas dokdonensis]|uniref:GtrA family protein n=1 Tax=Sphingomonas dokdonensis TaxID=344880 RepID=UPI001B80058E